LFAVVEAPFGLDSPQRPQRPSLPSASPFRPPTARLAPLPPSQTPVQTKIRSQTVYRQRAHEHTRTGNWSESGFVRLRRASLEISRCLGEELTPQPYGRLTRRPATPRVPLAHTHDANKVTDRHATRTRTHTHTHTNSERATPQTPKQKQNGLHRNKETKP